MERIDEVPEGGRPAPRLVHLLNGDTTREKLERSTVPGTFAVWADVLHEGPIPDEEASPAEWHEVRARYIARVGYAPYEEALAKMRDWDEGLERLAEHEELVIWCEHDLFDQLLLVRHLAWLARRGRGPAGASLICIGAFPGVPGFRGLGELAPEQLASLLETRQPVTERQLELGRAAWRAFASPDPTAIERLLAGDTSALPFLARALRRHLEEFPRVRDGLSRTEREILRALAGGPLGMEALFRAVQAPEDSFYIGDASFRTVLRGLAGGVEPAVELEGEGEGEGEGRGFLPAGIARLTAAGEALLAGRADRVRTNGIDRWLGGVHLRGRESPWRWTGERLAAAG